MVQSNWIVNVVFFQDIGVICEVSQTRFTVLYKMRSQLENSPHERNKRKEEGIKLVISLNLVFRGV
jgi:hypothetical protein